MAHHYDLSGALYDLFLDDDRQYSCAYFRTPNDSLEAAQTNKKRHLAAKLLGQPIAQDAKVGGGHLAGGVDIGLDAHPLGNDADLRTRQPDRLALDMEDTLGYVALCLPGELHAQEGDAEWYGDEQDNHCRP